MAKFNFETVSEKSALRDRAIMSKPRVSNVVATELGWCVPRPNGTLEVLVRFHGLDEILGDLSLDITSAVEPVAETTPVLEESATIESVAETTSVEPTTIVIPVAPKKPGPKPKIASVA